MADPRYTVEEVLLAAGEQVGFLSLFVAASLLFLPSTQMIMLAGTPFIH